MMPSITAMPSSAMKPIAAETLNEVPVSDSARMPPAIAIGITLSASSESVTDEKFMNSRIAMMPIAIGTVTERRAIAPFMLLNSPTSSSR